MYRNAVVQIRRKRPLDVEILWLHGGVAIPHPPERRNEKPIHNFH
jgi:hypothetical protein